MVDLHPKSYVDRLYVPRKERKRVLIYIEDCLGLAFRGLKVYIQNSDERLIQAATVDKTDVLKATSISKTKKKIGKIAE